MQAKFETATEQFFHWIVTSYASDYDSDSDSIKI